MFERKEHVPVWQVEEMGMMSCEVQGSRLWRCEVRGAAGCAGAVNPVVAGKQEVMEVVGSCAKLLVMQWGAQNGWGMARREV